MSITADNTTYRDDVNTPDSNGKTPLDKNYLRILFKPGYAVQTRELNQLQSLIQAQLDRVGESIFRAGKPVLGGLARFDDSLGIYSIDVTSNESLLGDTYNYITRTTSGGGEATSLQATITSITQLDTEQNGTFRYKIYIKNTNSETDTNTNSSIQKYVIGDTISISNLTDDTVSSINVTVEAVNTAVGAHIAKGVYFVKGCYAIVNEQYVAIDIPTGTKFTGYVALEIVEGVASSIAKPETPSVKNDDTLLDNAQGSLNYSANGADRYFIDLNLKLVNDDISSDSNYAILLRIENDDVALDNSNIAFSGLDDKLAQRTFEESGNYEVNPFPIHIREAYNDLTNGGLYLEDDLVDNGYPNISAAQNDLICSLDPSVAYVKGYRVELTRSIPLKFNKARTTETQLGAAVSADMGMYIDGSFSTGKAVLNIESVQTVYNLVNGSTQIGKAKIRSIESNGGGSYRLFLYDFEFTSTYSIGSIQPGTKLQSSVFEFVSDTVLKNADINTSLYSLPIAPIKNISDFKITKKQTFGGLAISSNGVVSVTLPDTNDIFDKSAANIIVFVNGNIIPQNDITVNPSPSGTLSLTLTERNNGTTTVITSGTATVIASVVTTPSRGIKKLKTKTVALGSPQNDVYTLSGIYHLVSVAKVNPNTDDTYEIVSDGQYGTHYAQAKIKRLSGTASNVSVTYYDFETPNAVYYDALSYKKDITVNSITSTINIPLEELPSYTDIQLSNVLDFRYYPAASAFSPIDPFSPITFDIEYYVPRIDSVVVNQSGAFNIISGIPSLDPRKPLIPDTGMELYTLEIAPYTFGPNDVNAKKVDNKRYTMSNIRALDKRITNLEYYTTLSFLEKSTNDTTILDADGVDRFKNGFVVDNFVGHNVSDPTYGNSVCAIDPNNNECRPAFSIQSLKLEEAITSNLSPLGYKSGVHDRAVTLPYKTVPYISQMIASDHESVNPFNIATFVGKLNLYPSSDYWIDTTKRPDVIVKDDNLNDAFTNFASGLEEELGVQILGTEWGSWETYWSGPVKSELVGTSFRRNKWGRKRRTNIYSLSQELAQRRDGVQTTIDTSKSVTKDLGERVIDISVRPYIRQRYVYFEARSLKPNTLYYPFFDGINVADYCYVRTANDIDKKSNDVSINGLPVSIPTRSTNDSIFKTDNTGALYGLFIIPNPNTSGLQFLSGTREFKLTDSMRNIASETTSFAVSDYVASGTVKTVESTILSTSIPELVRTSVQDERNITNQRIVRRRRKTCWLDPIAQSFLIQNQEGIFAAGIDLYFANKSSTNATIEVFIVTCENGIPTQNVIPLSTVIKNADDVNVSTDGSISTHFEFEQPVYLANGQEYAIVCVSVDNDYRVYTSTLGGTDIATNQPILANPYNGVFFKSQNSSTWTPDQYKDLKFVLHRAEFIKDNGLSVVFNTPSLRSIQAIKLLNAGSGYTTAPTVTISAPTTPDSVQATAIATLTDSILEIIMTNSGEGYITIPTVTISAPAGGGTRATAEAVMSNFQVSNFILNQDNIEIAISDTAKCYVKNRISILDTTYDVTPNATYIAYGTKQEWGAQNAVNRNNLVTLTTTLYTTSDYITPVVDTERLNVKLVSNNLRNDLTKTSRYVTRTIDLAEAADQIDIYFDVNRPSTTCDLKVYVNYDAADNWIPISLSTLNAIPVNSDIYTFDEVHYMHEPLQPFTSFRVKIEFVGSNIVDTPRIKNFRAIATT
jgi:hypothetical protein